jgi:hypothetical protein
MATRKKAGTKKKASKKAAAKKRPTAAAETVNPLMLSYKADQTGTMRFRLIQSGTAAAPLQAGETRTMKVTLQRATFSGRAGFRLILEE